jgi:hypothetical protein
VSNGEGLRRESASVSVRGKMSLPSLVFRDSTLQTSLTTEAGLSTTREREAVSKSCIRMGIYMLVL